VNVRLDALIAARERVLTEFLEREHAALALACHAIARAFARGGTLLAFGTGTAETDAAHVAVEFMHPVIVGKRALPALAPPNDLLRVARPNDVALGVAHREDPAVTRFLAEAARRGLLTISFGRAPADFVFTVESDDEHIVQEVQETAYHVLWELVHVFFEHPGLLQDGCITCGDVAVQARVVALRDRTAVIEKDGVHEEVAVDLVDVGVGDVVLCHAGVALEKVG
jgi:D-sedoheptulose 7-phosphate isomerase